MASKDGKRGGAMRSEDGVRCGGGADHLEDGIDVGFWDSQRGPMRHGISETIEQVVS